MRSYTWLPALCGALLLLSLATACTTAKNKPQAVWPDASVLPEQVPGALDTDASASVLRRDGQGLLYIVGGLDAKARAGDPFLARYSGEWPLTDVPRPPLAAGEIVRVYDGGKIALVKLLYMLPNTKLEELEITWQDDITREDIGKGIGRVEQLFGEADDPEAVELSIGKNLGVQPGDIYALVAAPDPKAEQLNALQLGRRMQRVCLVQSVTEVRSRCRIWHGSRLHPIPEPGPQRGDTALFLEHSFGTSPRQTVIHFARIKGDTDGSIREHLITQMEHYINTHAAANVTVAPIDLELDPTSGTFYKADQQVAATELPQLLVGAALVKRGGKEHILFNYTGVGAAAGPGMIAAPPERGIDLGRSDQITGTDLRHIFGLLLSGVMVYRGQTSEALMHLRQLLADEKLQGELRWHLRDQYAMRLAALGFVDEALWLVLEDEAVGVQREDRLATLNALGTRVRLHELLGATPAAVEQGRRYMELREQGKDDPHAVAAAISMYAEMLMSAGEAQLAMSQLERLDALCATACAEDMFNHISAIYWSVPPSEEALLATLLTRLEALERAHTNPSHTASLRLYQGLVGMREGLYEQALIAFMESERLLREQRSVPGVARAKYFAFLALLGMKEPMRAYETASELIAMANDLRDYAVAARTYDRMVSIYLSLDMEQAPGAYIKVASRILTAVYDAQTASGDLGKSSETLFTIGTLFFRLGGFDDAQVVLQKSVVYALRATRFDIAAMSHLTLAMLARSQGDMEGFMDELARAQTMGRLSGDPSVLEAIERASNPERPDPVDTPPVDTKLL